MVDGDGHPHHALTVFYFQMQQGLSEGTTRTYLNALLPYFTYLSTDEWRRHRGDCWNSPPEAVRESVRDYLMQHLRCKARLHSTCEVISLTLQSPSTVRIFLSALKQFYIVACRGGWYEYPHPLTDAVAHLLQEVEQEERRVAGTRPRMPQTSGVEEPRQRHSSDNYFHLKEEEWIPHPIDDPHLHQHLLAGFKLANFCLRDQIVVRIAYESGARIREILQLTLGDWQTRGWNQEATTFSKGSRGRRVKVIRFSSETAKMLREYINTDRRALDSQQRRLEQLEKTDPLFFSQRRKPYDYEAFKPHWYALCATLRIDLNVHGLRHWYVTQAIRHICETAQAPDDIIRGKEDLVRYMAWRNPETLKAYEHFFQAERHAKIQDQLYQRFYERDMTYINEQRVDTQHGHVTRSKQGVPASPTQQQPSGWDMLLALGGTRDA